MATDEGPQATGGFTRRTVLRGGLLAGAGVATAGAMSGVLTGAAKAATTSGPQSGWGYCVNCSTMWWTAGQATSQCASPNAPFGSLGYRYKIHVFAKSNHIYALKNNMGNLNNNSNPQPGWCWCSGCQGLFWGGSGGVCLGYYSGPHIAGSGTSYDLSFNVPGKDALSDPQAYWHWCNLCSLLYWQGPSGDTTGACPAFPSEYNNAHHAGSSTNYCISW